MRTCLEYLSFFLFALLHDVQQLIVSLLFRELNQTHVIINNVKDEKKRLKDARLHSILCRYSCRVKINIIASLHEIRLVHSQNSGMYVEDVSSYTNFFSNAWKISYTLLESSYFNFGKSPQKRHRKQNLLLPSYLRKNAIKSCTVS